MHSKPPGNQTFNLETYFDENLRPVAKDPESMMDCVISLLTQVEILMNNKARGKNSSAEAKQTHQQIAKHLGNAAAHLLVLGHLDEAKEYLEASLSLIGEHDLGVHMWTQHSLRYADVMRFLEEWDEAEDLFDDLLEICQRHPAVASYQDFAWQHLGKLHFDKKDFAAAEDCFQHALRLRQEKRAQASFQLAAADELSTEDRNKAEKALEDAHELINSTELALATVRRNAFAAGSSDEHNAKPTDKDRSSEA